LNTAALARAALRRQGYSLPTEPVIIPPSADENVRDLVAAPSQGVCCRCGFLQPETALTVDLSTGEIAIYCADDCAASCTEEVESAADCGTVVRASCTAPRSLTGPPRGGCVAAAS
jgi:hypothetical protein